MPAFHWMMACVNRPMGRFLLLALLALQIAPAFAAEYRQAVIIQGAALQGSAALNQELFARANFPNVSEFYGGKVLLQGDTLIVAVSNDGSSATGINGNEADNSAPQSGAVYVYVRQDGQWVQQAYIKASNANGGDVFGNPGDLFGNDIDFSGNTLVVGAPEERSGARGVNGNQNDNTIINAGAAYVFVRNNGFWSQQAYLKASNSPQVVPNFNTFFFGAGVAIDGDTIAIGAPAEDSLSSGINGSQSYVVAETFRENKNTGAVYVFTRSGNNWSQQSYIKASNPTSARVIGNPGTGSFVDGDNFGGILDLSGDTAESSEATGIGGDQNNEESPLSGAVYVFQRNGSAWSQQAYIKASNTGQNDIFGSALAIEGDRLAVGAPNENSNATGLNGDQENNTIGRAGAVYLFERNGSNWQQTDYMKSSNPGFGDQFGFSLSFDGDRLLVGANGEASGATGMNGDQADNSKAGAGAAYLFERVNGQWQQTAYIKASNPDPGDTFGDSVALDGDLMAIGASRANGVAGGLYADQADNSILSSGAVYVFNGVGAQQSVNINQGMNDAWVSEQAPLQGLFFTVYENIGVFFLSWFTFDSQVPVSGPVAVFGAEDQRWVTASGTFSGNTATLNAELTSGGVFNSDTPLAMQDAAYGTITIVFNSCNEAVLSYNFPGVGLSGQMTLTRVVTDNVALCEALSK